eukprot:GHVP01061672.1.p1 GENE.GHVP01061672.1~~GHVP01061672.1.p1  ORF type:complete len:280 (+),score=51.00 GHVP01061672.1:30-869(+)
MRRGIEAFFIFVSLSICTEGKNGREQDFMFCFAPGDGGVSLYKKSKNENAKLGEISYPDGVPVSVIKNIKGESIAGVKTGEGVIQPNFSPINEGGEDEKGGNPNEAWSPGKKEGDRSISEGRGVITKKQEYSGRNALPISSSGIGAGLDTNTGVSFGGVPVQGRESLKPVSGKYLAKEDLHMRMRSKMLSLGGGNPRIPSSGASIQAGNSPKMEIQMGRGTSREPSSGHSMRDSMEISGIGGNSSRRVQRGFMENGVGGGMTKKSFSSVTGGNDAYYSL